MNAKTAEEIHNILSTLKTEASDKTASKCAEIYETLKEDGSLVERNTRIYWNGTVKKAAVDLWDRPENNPDNAPNLWEDIEYRDGIRIIRAPITATNPFNENELGWWGDDLYRSKVNANVYTPDEYPPNWEKQIQE